MNVTVQLPDELLDEIRNLVRGELERESPEGARGLLNVKSAAAYLDMSEDALRGLVKRRQIEFQKSVTGRITFTQQELEAHARGDLR
jgi:hypothetical protein